MGIIPALYARGDVAMPIYEYECRACGVKKEFIQKVGDAPIDLCESCGARGTMKRLISAPMIQFKGSGWYVTDYSKKGKGGTAASVTAESDSSQDSPAKKDSDAKSDSADASTSTD